jgi:hypothetical protein
MQKIKCKTVILFISGLVVLSLNAFAQKTESLNYISPKPNAEFINIQHEIAIRHGDIFNILSLNNSLIEVTGSMSGHIEGEVRLSADKRTLIFKPELKFEYHETISVNIKSGLLTESGIQIAPFAFSFTTMNSDNTKLKTNFVDWETSQYMNDINDKPSSIPAPINLVDNKLELPDDFPVFNITAMHNPAPGYIFLTSHNPLHPVLLPSYSIIIDHYGTPVYYKKTNSHATDLKMQETGQVSHFLPSSAAGLGIAYGDHLLYDSYMNVIDTFQMGNGYTAEVHDFQLFNDGSSLMFTYDPQIIDMSLIVEGGDPAATVMGFVLQELDAEKNVVFEWASWDHMSITDATPDIDLTAVFIDYCHGNAVERDTDGNILVSFRNTDEIIKIDRNTGEIMWRLNAFRDDLNDFEFINDTIKFSHQHDIRRQPNGNITLFDNGNLHSPPYSRICEYALNEVDMTAELIWVYPPEYTPSSHFAFATGGAHRQENGNTMVGWGIKFPFQSEALIFGEITPEHQTTYAVWGTDTLTTYRAHKYNWETDLFTLSKDTIDWGEFSGYTAQPYIIQISNNDDEAITIAQATNRTSEFFVSSVLPMTIAAGATETLTVNYFPSIAGNFEDALTIMCQKSDVEMIGKQIVLLGHTVDGSAPSVSFDPIDGAIDIVRMPELKISFSEKLFKADGGIITNEDLQDLFFLSSGSDIIPYDARITWYDNKKTEILIQPVDYLEANTIYLWGIIENTVADWNGNMISETESSTFTTDEELGIFDSTAEEFIKIFPNPHAGELTIEFENEDTRAIWVYDFYGKLINEIPTIKNSVVKLDFTSESNGIYFITVRNLKNKKLTTIKTLKH